MVINVFSLFCYYLFFKKVAPLHFNKSKFPALMMLCEQFGCNWPSGPWQENENGKKFTRQQWWTKDNFFMRRADLNLQIRWARNCLLSSKTFMKKWYITMFFSYTAKNCLLCSKTLLKPIHDLDVLSYTLTTLVSSLRLY